MIVTEKPRDFKGTVGKLIRFMGRFKFAMAVALVFAIGSTVFNVIGPKVLSTATTELFNGIVAKVEGTGGINFDAIWTILVTTLGIYLASAACQFVQGWILTYVSQKTCYEFRREISEKIDRLPVGYFERTSTGDTLSRITNDVDTLGQSLNQGISELLRAVVTLVGVVAIMFSINVPMTLVTLLIVPVSLVFIRLIVKRSQKHFYAQQANLGTIDGQIEETFSGHAIVKAYGREQAAIDEFNATNERLFESAWKSQFLSGLMRPVMDVIGNLGYVVVAIMGSIFAVQGVITVGDIQAFIQYVKNFTQPITQLAQVSNVLQQTAAAAERVFEFLEADEEPAETPEVRTDELACDVEFDHVHFGYDPDKPVIKDFSARVEEGQTVAFVGPTGAGKTTLVKLLMRFYDVQGGAIRIGGTDVRDLDREDVRSLFGMVLQDTWLFHGTVRDNIRYGKPDATDEEVEEAARRAYVHHFIETLPDGYDCMINEDASNISAGQRQLLTIARAFLADRRMLVLDEATSSVDTRTEERIQGAMDSLMVGRTSFVIAHRLSTIRNADLLLVINEGDIVEQGTHAELLEQDGFYAELYNSQFH
ncbi:MAG: ABC transporter ATP-binding protein [Eggerthellaceae bacterium]|nr:ABC transporter ATP-binding protein [Eggerthellaceae bacterium]